MSYKIEKLPNEPIILGILNADHNVATDGPHSMKEVMKLLDAQTEQVYLVMDIQAVNFGLDDAIQAASMVTKQNQLLSHPRIIERVIVTNSRLMQLVAQGMKSATFGNISMNVFDSQKAALAYVRAQNVARTP